MLNLYFFRVHIFEEELFRKKVIIISFVLFPIKWLAKITFFVFFITITENLKINEGPFGTCPKILC